MISSLYSSEENYIKSNFYLKISSFLNPKFKFNSTLLVENFYINEKYTQAKIALENFNRDDGIITGINLKKIVKFFLRKRGRKNHQVT